MKSSDYHCMGISFGESRSLGEVTEMILEKDLASAAYFSLK